MSEGRKESGLHFVVSSSDGVEHKIPVFADDQKTESAISVPHHDSANWTGPKHILVDQKVLSAARQSAEELREIVYAFQTTDNALSSDLKTLVDALLQLLKMCEPELGPIDHILASPRFRVSAALMAAAATVRGALGI